MAYMKFGYKSYFKSTGQSLNSEVRQTACWAALKWHEVDRILTEVTWEPENKQSEHVKVLLPLLFPDIKYKEEVNNGRYQIRFSGLEEVYRHNFMFRMFVIRNIDRDHWCRVSFEYFWKAGYNPLEAAAISANMDIYCGFSGRKLAQKGYACCFSDSITVADVRAFARNPSKHHKGDTKFGEGRGYGYLGKTYNPRSIQEAILNYKPSSPKFSSKEWGGDIKKFLVSLFKDNKLATVDLAEELSKIKVTE